MRDWERPAGTPKDETSQRDDRATLLPGNESPSVREGGVSIQGIAEKAALKISTPSKAMLDNESKKDSTHSQEVLSVTEVAETKDQSKSGVQAEPGDKSNWFGSVFGAVSATASAVGSAAASAGSAIVDTASAVGNAAGTAGSAIVDTASAVGNAAVSAGSAIFVNTASAVGNAAASAGSAAMQVPNFFGSSLVFISQSPILKKLTQKFKIDWLVNAIDAVDVVNAEAQVRELQRQYPHEKPEEIAHHLMVEKALLAAGSGLVSSLVPGVALALSGMDLAAMTALSAELVYQIAAAYGMDLRSSDRKAEVVAIFGLSLGSNLAIEAGVTLVSNIPLAGAVINASASATMIYALGYGACRFYEAHLDSSEIETKLEDLQEVLQAESEQYLETAIAQETVMDWILVYVVYASKKFTRWDELLPELRAANLNPRTLAEIEAVTNKSKLLPKLDILLAQLELDFAEPLLKRCTEIVEADGEINQQEGKILLTIQRAVLSKRKQAQKPAQQTSIEDGVSEATEAQTEVQAESQIPSLSSDSPSTNKLSSSMLQNFQKIIKVAGRLDVPKIANLIDTESQAPPLSSHSPSTKLSAILLKKFKQILAGSTRLEVAEIGYLIDQVDRMTGEEFEEFLACCFRNLGYAVEMTPKTGDFGADLILSKARKKTVVQAKRYQGKVGNSAVQEVVSAVKYYGAQDAIVITNSMFTSNAHKLAQANGVQLWGREQLIDLVMRAKK